MWPWTLTMPMALTLDFQSQSLKELMILTLDFSILFPCMENTWDVTLVQGWRFYFPSYRQVSNVRCTLVDNKIVDHSDVVGASPVGAAPTTFSLST